jgi:hypothetical protein
LVSAVVKSELRDFSLNPVDYAMADGRPPAAALPLRHRATMTDSIDVSDLVPHLRSTGKIPSAKNVGASE